MSFFESALLGILQGLTEFLPISSSAHLIVMSWLQGGKPLPLSLNVSLHLGTLLAIVFFFWRDWLDLAVKTVDRIFRGKRSFQSDVLLPGLVLGTIPAAIVGGLWEHRIEELFHHPQSVILPLVIVGIALWWTDRQSASDKSFTQVSIKDALVMGCFQTLALVPGVSRSGITILGARLLKISREDAAKFSFMLGCPAMAGAVVLKLKAIIASSADPIFYIGTVVSAIVGAMAMKFLLAFLKKYGFGWFAVYRILFACLIMYFVMTA